MVVDDSYEKIQEISDKVSYAMKADVTDKDALQAAGARNSGWSCCGGIRASGSEYYGNTSLQRDGGFHWWLQRRKINFKGRSWKK